MSFRSRKVSGAPLVATETSNPISRDASSGSGAGATAAVTTTGGDGESPVVRIHDAASRTATNASAAAANAPRRDRGLTGCASWTLSAWIWGWEGSSSWSLVERGPGVGESARAYRGSRRLQPPFDPALACALLEPRPALHGHERAFAALQLCGARSWSVAQAEAVQDEFRNSTAAAARFSPRCRAATRSG